MEHKMHIKYLFALSLLLTTVAEAQDPVKSAMVIPPWQPGQRHVLTETLSLGGSIRSRYESRSDFKFGDNVLGNNDDFLLNQLRLNLKWKATDKTNFFIESQSSFVHGDKAIDENVRPNTFAEDFDIHQLYGETSFLLGNTNASLKVGRQKFNFGGQRLIGALEWVNTSRVFDAVSLTLGVPEHNTTQIFSSRAVAVDPDNINDWGFSGNRYTDSTLHGVYYSDKDIVYKATTDLYYLFRNSEAARDAVSTVGVRISGKSGHLDYTTEDAYQFGEFGGLRQSAWMAHIELGATVDEASKSRLAVAYNYGSGDSDATDKTHQTFDNLFPTNHAPYGYMDFVSLENIHNLELAAERNIVDALSLRLAYQNFWLDDANNDSWYNAGMVKVRTATTNVSSYLGSELDVTLKYPLLNKRLSLEATYGHFFPGSYIEQTGPSEEADFFILMGKFEL